MWSQQNRYFNTKKVVNELGKWDSKFESGYAQELQMRLKAKDIAGYDCHVSMPLEVNGYHIGDYKIDFVVYNNDETVEYVETKGWADSAWRIKWKIFCAMHEDNPNEKITLVWQGKNHPKMRKIKKL